jgi:type I restriction enzyme S subunit
MKTEIPEGYKNSPVGIIPEDWEVRKLGEICTNFKSGQNITSPNISDSDKYPVYGGNGLRGYTNSFTHFGDFILIGRQGALCGNIYLVSGENYISEHAIAVKTDLNNDIRFWAFKLDYLNLNSLSESSAQPGLSVEKLIKLKVSIPPLPEQQKIAKILSVWDFAIEKQTLLIEKLELRKRALMQQLLTGKKRLKGFEGEWKKVKLGEIGEISSAGVDKTIIVAETPVRLLNYLDVYRRDFLFDSELDYWVTAKKNKIENCSVKKGDVFFTPSSEVPNDIGNSAVAMEDILNAVYSYHVVRLRIIDDWDLKFRAYAFKTDYFYRQAERFCDGSGQRYVISQANFRKISVIVPSKKEEQAAIAEILSTADKEIHIAKEKLVQIKKQKKGLMQVLLTGKKRVIITTNI